MSAIVNTPPKEVGSRKLFLSLQTTDLDTDTTVPQAIPIEDAVSGKTGRPPPIVLTPASKLVQFQKQMESAVN